MAAFVLFVYNFPLLLYSDPAGPWVLLGIAVTAVVMVAGFLSRRRAPLASYLVVLAAAVLKVVLAVISGGLTLLPIDLLMLPAVYQVASRHGLPIWLPAMAAAAVWAGVAGGMPISGELRPKDIAWPVLLVLLAATWGVVARGRRERIEALAERVAQLDRERELRDAVAAANERTRIARELHDILAHSLSVVVVLSDGAALQLRSQPDQAAEAIEQVRETSRSALAQLRDLLGVLRSDETAHSPQPRLDSLPKLLEQSQLPARLDVVGEPIQLPLQVELAAYRIIQEALTNIRKHAVAVSVVQVALTYGEGDLRVEVTDDGHGKGEVLHGGFGLAGMRERAIACGGTLTAGPGDSGFQVVAMLPTREEEE